MIFARINLREIENPAPVYIISELTELAAERASGDLRARESS